MSGGKGGKKLRKQRSTPNLRAGFSRRSTEATSSPERTLNYMGLVQAAPSDVTKNYYSQTNDMANLLGVGMARASPLTACRATSVRWEAEDTTRRGVQQELQRQHRGIRKRRRAQYSSPASWTTRRSSRLTGTRTVRPKHAGTRHELSGHYEHLQR